MHIGLISDTKIFTCILVIADNHQQYITIGIFEEKLVFTFVFCKAS